MPSATQYHYGGVVAAVLVFAQGSVFAGIESSLNSYEFDMVNIAIGIRTKLIKLADSHSDIECYVLTRDFEWLH